MNTNDDRPDGPEYIIADLLRLQLYHAGSIRGSLLNIYS
jgi:hypothetical protein